MSEHHCHALGCKAPCPPRWLMCKRHWRMVPPELQDEVYATVKKRGRYVDATWAPWWRAQAKAIAHVGHAEQPYDGLVERYLAKEMAFADTLEARGT